MKTTKHIKQSILILSFATLLAGCGGGSSATSGTTASTTTPTTLSAKAIHSGQVKDSSTGDGLANVKVSLGEFTTITDENGLYTLSDLLTSE